VNRNEIIEILVYADKFYKKLEENNKIIIYGAGYVGEKVISALPEKERKKIIAIAVTHIAGNRDKIEKITVHEIESLQAEDNTIVIVAVGDEKRCAVKIELAARGFQEIADADWYKLDIYNILLKIKRENLIELKTKMIFEKTIGINKIDIYEKVINLGRFFEKLPVKEIEFSMLCMNWGGSGILDYSLLRGLIIKYKLKTYLEIGTYIGDSLTVVADLVKTCYSISVSEEHPAHMKNWCKEHHINDYTNKLVIADNIVQFQEDSKYFDYSKVKEKIDLFFIDGDHSYSGVFLDSIKIFDILDVENSFVIWHDCRTAMGANLEVIEAIYDAIGKYFNNFFIFDNCMCGIYIPDKYISDFIMAQSSDPLITYKISLMKNSKEL